jgi:hypothetical protein
MKKFILGFIVAAVLFSAIPVGAAVQEYILTSTAAKIVVDGIEVKSDVLPIMAYEGYNYIPAAMFRDICGKIGVGFEWDNTAKEIQITTDTITTSTGISNEIKVTNNKSPDGILINTINGDCYISIYSFISCYRGKYEFAPDSLLGGNTNEFVLVCINDGGKSVKDGTVILRNIPLVSDGGTEKNCIPYDYYVNTVLPLIN